MDSAAVDSAAVDSAVAVVANTPDYYTVSFSLYRPLPHSLSRRLPCDRKFDTAPRTFRVRTTVYRTTRVAIPPYSQSSAAAADFHPRPRSPLALPRTLPTPTRARTPISRVSRSPARDRRVDVPPTSPRFRLRAPTFESASPLNDEFFDRPSPRPDGCSRRALATRRDRTGVRDSTHPLVARFALPLVARFALRTHLARPPLLDVCSPDSQSVSVRPPTTSTSTPTPTPRTARGDARTHTKRDDFDRSVRRSSSVVRPSSSTRARLFVLVIIIHASSVSTYDVFLIRGTLDGR